MSEDTQHERRLMLIAAIGLLIIVLAARLLLLTETSLNQGRGPGLEGEGSVSILPLMILIITLLGLLLIQLRNSPLTLSSEHTKIAAMMAVLFLIGMLFEPEFPRPSNLLERDAIGLLLILVPLALIANMLQSTYQGSNAPLYSEEEE